MFKIVLLVGTILLIVGIIVLSALTAIKKIKYKTLWVLLPVFTLIIALGCGISNALIADDVSLLSNWKTKVVSQETTCSDEIKMYIKKENGKTIIEKVDNTYYFYSDENTEFLNSIYNRFDNVTFKVSDKTSYVIKKNTNNLDYEYKNDSWFVSNKDTSVIDEIKTNERKHLVNSTKQHITDSKASSFVQTELVFYVPKDTLIKTKDNQDTIIYKTIDEFNRENKSNLIVYSITNESESSEGVEK